MPADTGATYPFASLPANLAAFCAVLRQQGFRVGTRELHDAALALQAIAIGEERAVRDALRPIMSHRVEDVEAFDQAFERFFHPRRGFPSELGRADDSRRSTGDQPAGGATFPAGVGDLDAEPDETHGTETTVPVAVDDSDAGTSPRAGILRSAYSPAESEGAPLDLGPVDAAWRAAAAVFARRIETKLSRRWKPAPRGRQFDLRRTLRASLHTGGEAVLPRWRTRPRLLARFVVIIDGSRSMAAHREPAVHVAVALASVVPGTEVFVFSTALRDVTRDVRRAIAGERRALELHHAWGGGTGIGECLRDFVHRYGWQVLGRDAVLIIASDGLDLGPPEMLRHAMAQVRRRSAAIIWLNPLVETAGYEPIAAGMRAALPFVSTFAWAGDAGALVRLAGQVRVTRRR